MHFTELVILEYPDIIILVLHIMVLMVYMFSYVCFVAFLVRKEQNLLAMLMSRWTSCSGIIKVK